MSGNGTVNGPLVNNGTVLVTNGVMIFSGIVTNNGIMRFTGGASLLATNATFVNNGVLDIITGLQSLPPNFINSGTVLTPQQVNISQVALSGGSIQVNIQGYSGHYYQLQSCSSLGSGPNWNNVGVQQAGTGVLLTFTNAVAISNSTTFYRVSVTP